MENDLVSIIVPIYNSEEYLSDCIESLCNQTYRNIEILLINDGSEDSSEEICKKYSLLDSRIRIFNQKNEGVSAARNRGIKLSKGNWILCVDSDDWIDLNTIKFAMEAVTDDTDICFIGIKETSNSISEKVSFAEKLNIVALEKKDFRDLQFRILNRDRNAKCDRNLIKVSSPCKFYKKQIIEKNNIIFPKELPNGEDGIFNLYYYQHSQKGIAIENALYWYRKNPNSATRKFTPTVEQDFARLHQEYRRFILQTDNPQDFKDLWNERLIWSFSFCCILKYCHPDNPASYKKRRQAFLETLNQQYKTEIAQVKLTTFGLQKKIIFEAIKKRWFFLVSILCYLNNRKG